MNWRRGSMLAGIHLAIVIPLIVSEILPRWETEKTHAQNFAPSLRFAGYQEEGGTVEFTPTCEGWGVISWRGKVIIVSELPAVLLSGWGDSCPAPWTLAGVIGLDNRHNSLVKETASSAGLCGLVAIQWLLLGGLPLIRPRRWWLEPGACNTASTVAAVALLLVGYGLTLIPLSGSENSAAAFGILSVPFLMVVFLTWIVWLVLVAWRGARFSTRLLSGARARFNGRSQSVNNGDRQ